MRWKHTGKWFGPKHRFHLRIACCSINQVLNYQCAYFSEGIFLSLIQWLPKGEKKKRAYHRMRSECFLFVSYVFLHVMHSYKIWPKILKERDLSKLIWILLGLLRIPWLCQKVNLLKANWGNLSAFFFFFFVFYFAFIPSLSFQPSLLVKYMESSLCLWATVAWKFSVESSFYTLNDQSLTLRF